ncbi:Chemotaxis regulator - transmits chemoreceptor signals to flagelllar motor components CheY [Brevinematales bacterium NS]|nr:response regulator [Brevinematales bacterium]QJR21005.1 Chemotaxis regulator - transmits chemoreceptor signals to flagelllar motor components CheY [Brevinematales bacterium NS]
MYNHILIADDSSTSRMIIQRCLQIVGLSEATFYEAGDGIEALDLLNRHPEIDLIVTDINMPKMDGANFIRRMKADPVLSQKDVIVVSSVLSGPLIDALQELKVKGMIKKPINPQELYKVLKG